MAFVTLRFPSGIVAQVELSWLSPSKLRRTVVVGSEKMVVYEDGAPEPIRLFDHGVVYRDPETFGEYQLSYRTGDIVSPKLEYERAAAASSSGTSVVPSARGDEMSYQAALARDVVAITEAASRSLEAGGAEVHVERSAPLATCAGRSRRRVAIERGGGWCERPAARRAQVARSRTSAAAVAPELRGGGPRATDRATRRSAARSP